MKIDWHVTVQFIKDDWNSNPFRLIIETINWLLNLIIAMIFTVTIPNVNLHLVYPLFFIALSSSLYSAISRGSFGLLITTITIYLIDIAGYIKLLSS